MVGAVLVNFAFDRQIRRLLDEVKRPEGELERLSGADATTVATIVPVVLSHLNAPPAH